MGKFLKCIIFLLLMSSVSLEAQAQYYSSGQDPASIHWNQINSSHFQIIYPRGYDSIAQHVMNVMEYGRVLTLKTRHVEPKKMSVILHNQTIVSNAEVAWAPRRIEFYTVTPQSTYSQPWYEQLAIHEYTHVLQISAIKDGVGGVLNAIFGEQYSVGVWGLYVPYWFIEGDAVVAETALSQSGRGRDPNFEADLRAQLVELGSYSLEKASLGSYEDFTANRYCLGYYLVGMGRVNYGLNFWNKPLNNVSRHPYMVVPFGKGIKANSGLEKKAFYEQTILQLTEEWNLQLEETKLKSYKVLTSANGYINYTNNAFLNGQELFSLKKDYHDLGRFVKVDTTGQEELIFTPGFYKSEAITIGGDILCWSEQQYDPRWDYRSWIKILTLNLKTGKKKVIAKKTRYFSPKISPSGKKIVVAEVDEMSQHYLVVLNTEDGSVLHRIPSPDNDFIAHPAWSPDETMVVAEVLNSHGKGLAIFELESLKVRNVLAYQSTHLQYPSFWKHYVLFEASYSGVMNVFALDLKTKSLYQTTHSAFSASHYSISPDGKNIVFSDHTAKGKQLVMGDWNPKEWLPFSEVENKAYPLADELSKQADTLMDPDAIPQKEFEVRKYRKAAHLFNIHSWSPLSVDLDNYTFSPGLNILSQNKLSTLSMRLGANYDLNTQLMKYSANVDYFGWYPVLSLRGDYGGRWAHVVEEGITKEYYYNESNLGAALYLPLLFTSGTWSHNVQPEVSFTSKQIDKGQEIPFNFRSMKITSYAFQYSAQRKRPSQNIFPQWAYSLIASYAQSPFNAETGEILMTGITGYLPGLFRHDGFRMMAQYQDKIGDADFYSNRVGPARGYTGLVYDDLLSLRADYKVPVIYPDWNISSIIYLKRIVVGLFFDYSILTDVKAQNAYHGSNSYWSSGVDLTTDIHLLRSKFPFEIGLRSTFVNGYINNPQGVYFQFLWGISI